MISAIVLAAGASSRMGQAKAALPLGRTGETVVARVVRTLLDGGVPDVVVVAGAHIDAVRAAMPVRPSTVAEVIAVWRRTRAPIVRRADGQRHGHPVMFDRSIFADLRAADPNTGAKAVFAIHRDRIVNVEVNDAGAFEDVDTPEDYKKVLRADGPTGSRK